MGATLSSPYLLNQKQLYINNLSSQTQSQEEFSLAENVYEPESIFSGWLNLSFFSVTAAMVFYDLTRRKSLLSHPILVAIIAIGLILISVSYVYFGIYPYYKRMSLAIDKCISNTNCSKVHLDDIKRLRNELTIIGIGTIIMESLIAILIIWNTYKLL